ncbi:MAG: hypothetical protein IJ894_03045 [Bacteroidales bacterium]|nr:hypothetical protein [Bacteroidales bacterium]MBR3711569.1 hypothetical protein [Bacteroidales bacterium]
MSLVLDSGAAALFGSLSYIAGGNAQNDNMDTPVCGGYRSNNHNTKPRVNPYHGEQD